MPQNSGINYYLGISCLFFFWSETLWWKELLHCHIALKAELQAAFAHPWLIQPDQHWCEIDFWFMPWNCFIIWESATPNTISYFQKFVTNLGGALNSATNWKLSHFIILKGRALSTAAHIHSISKEGLTQEY